MKETTLKPIIIKLLKTNNAEKILKANREKKIHCVNREKNKNEERFLVGN